jgi:hypothetical protein
MKITRILFILIVILFLSACAPTTAWETYSVEGDTTFLPYSFDHPSSWTVDAGSNYIGFVSDSDLLTDVPKKLETGQIIVGLSMNINMSPEEMVLARSQGLDDIIRFEEPVSQMLDGRAVVYQTGINVETKDESLFIAVDLGHNMRGLLTSRMAEGELELWRETLLQIVKSWRVQA